MTEIGSVQFACPYCGVLCTVTQVQGDRCPGCGFEFKWFGPGEEPVVQDYLTILTGEKRLLELPDDQGYIIAHE